MGCSQFGQFTPPIFSTLQSGTYTSGPGDLRDAAQDGGQVGKVMPYDHVIPGRDLAYRVRVVRELSDDQLGGETRPCRRPRPLEHPSRRRHLDRSRIRVRALPRPAPSTEPRVDRQRQSLSRPPHEYRTLLHAVERHLLLVPVYREVELSPQVALSVAQPI